MTMQKNLMRATAAAALALTLGPVHAQGVIKIGEINSYKAQPAFLEPYKKGMELAVEEINAKGGVAADKFDLLAVDATLGIDLFNRQLHALLVGLQEGG